MKAIATSACCSTLSGGQSLRLCRTEMQRKGRKGMIWQRSSSLVVLTLCGTLRADVTPQGCLDPECKPSKKLASVKLRKKAVVGGESSKEQCLEMVQRNQQGLDRVAMSARADAP